MIAANEALAPGSAKRGVLFYGMAGSGKTACALELTYRHQSDRFQGFVWYKAPDEGQDVETALLDLATAMEAQLPGLKMVHLVDRPDEFAAWLPRLTEVLARHSILIVLDNLESLLTQDNAWGDERWGKLIDALLAHSGHSRTVLTSRRLPERLADDDRLQRESIHALSLDEAALLARELPNLGRLLRGDGPVTLARSRELVSRTLHVVQGHPKLIDFAERQAADLDRLQQHLDRAAEAWKGDEAQLRAFFDTGESGFEAEEFLEALGEWTQAISSTLPEASRTLFHFFCSLEEDDRRTAVLRANWSDLWKRLELPGEAPDLEATLARVAQAGLVDSRPIGEDAFTYDIHPGVAEAGREDAGDTFQEAVDAELTALWLTMFQHSHSAEMAGGSGMLVHAARSAAPYLLRRKKWEEAATLLEQAIRRDKSPSTLGAVLPLLRHIVEETRGSSEGRENAGVFARALANAGRVDEAENLVRETIGEMAQQGEYRAAAAVSGDLVNLLRNSGRYAEALLLVDEIADYTRQAGLGPWSQLADEGTRLQVLFLMGEYEQVLSKANTLRQRMRTLTEEGPEAESVSPWNVREGILNVALLAARELGSHDLALELNQEAIAGKRRRGAPPIDIARASFNSYGPLLELGRYHEARAVLEECRAVFEAENDRSGLGRAFSGLADLEDELGHRDQAIWFEETALRYTYLSVEPDECSVSHFNLANYLMRARKSPEAALAHRLAAGVIRVLTGSGRWPHTRSALGMHLVQLLPKPPIPKSFDELCEIVEQVEGVRFRDLFHRLAGPDADGDAVLKQVLADAVEAMKEMAEEAKREGDQKGES
jgi:tetratricopeptide (TPR) repeat protein